MPIRSSDSSSPPPRVLVRGVNWLGDAVMTTPALHRLREYLPNSHITLLTTANLAELWLTHPSLNEVLSFAPGESPWTVAARLRPAQYDLALVLPNSPRSAMETWLTGIPRRIGYARSWRRWFLTQSVAPRAGVVTMHKLSRREVVHRIRHAEEKGHPSSVLHQSEATAAAIPIQAHHIHHYLHLAAALGANPEPLAPRLVVSAEEVSKVETSLHLRLRDQIAMGSQQSMMWLGVSPSAAYGPAKRWPAEHFAAVAREVSRKLKHCVWLVLGGSEDVKLCDEIAQHAGSPVINLAGQTSLRELMAVLKLCRALLTNDSGPMHVAAALGTPVVVPFGSTSPELTGPGLPGDARHHLLKCAAPCSPCFRRTCPIDFRCMTGIGIEQVLDAVLAAARTS